MVERLVTRNPVEAFIRSMRPWNLLVIGASMGVIRWKLIAPFQSPALSTWDFVVAVASMVFIAASGNLINDYFDIREDRVNRPNRALVGRVVSRRAVLAGHHVCVALGLSCAAWLSWNYGSWLFLGWASVLTTLLWGYSPWFKRRFFWGNLILAIIVGQLPLFTGLMEWTSLSWPVDRGESSYVVAAALTVYAVLSLWVTGLREAVKDLLNRSGDLAAQHRTLAVRLGERRTRKALQAGFFMGWSLLCAGAWFATKAFDANWQLTLFMAPYAAAHLYQCLGREVQVSAWLKLTLAGGLAFLATLPV